MCEHKTDNKTQSWKRLNRHIDHTVETRTGTNGSYKLFNGFVNCWCWLSASFCVSMWPVQMLANRWSCVAVLILVHPVLHPALETSELLLVRTSLVYDIQVVPLELLKLSNNVQTYHDNWPVWRKTNLCGPPQLTKLMHFISLASSLCVKKLHLPEQRLNQ